MAMFDTLKVARRLTDAGFDEEKAGAIVSVFSDDLLERLATKDDIRQLEERLDHRLTIRMGMVATTATGVLLAAIGIATGVLASL